MHAKHTPATLMWRTWIKQGLQMSNLCCLTGCSLMGGKDTILPQDGPSMKAVYESHFQQSRQRQHSGRERMEAAGPGSGDSPVAGYSRDAATEIQGLFPRLPNPALVMYVFPHLTGTGQPVPGYATAFSMYEKDAYALPGESEGQ